MHYGLLPRANRGIFAINELPDLAGKIQVGLFNILQEGDVQIKGYPIRLQARRDARLHRQPRGLHGARQDHHAAQGPHRLGDPHALSRRRARNAMAITKQEAWTDRAGALKVEIPRLRARGRRGDRVPGARRSQDRQAVGRQPAAADHDARARRLERRAPRARQRRDARRAARHRHLRGAAVDHRQVRARIRRRAARRRAGRARPDPLGGRQRSSPASSTASTRARSSSGSTSAARCRSATPSSADDVIAQTRGVQGLRELADARRPAAGRGRAGRRVGDRLRARRPVRAEEDQPQRRARLRRRRSGAAPRPTRREEATIDEEIRMPGGKKKYYN